AKIIAPSGLNVRKSASESATRIGGVYYNNTVTIVAKAGDFYKIKFGSGFGYIINRSSYLTIQNANSKPNTNTPLKENDIFSEALAFTLGVEGGYVYDRYDYGGPTNMGVTQSTYNTYRDQKKLPRKDIRSITFEEAREVYYTLYWKAAKCDKMDRTLAIVMFDTAVNLGVNGNSKAGGAIKHLQKAMNINPDGSWGSKTETAFGKFSKSQHYQLALKVVDYNKAFRYERVKQDASQKKFLEGWINRDNKLLAYIKKIGK
ncbi:glycosyl hydrolase 108 family protein, partial [Niallia sp. NCCP-28]|uniref:glycosyl hydrolase 108 family protein n=1 Tax=Niallia sp. NCCP-28 TaxID=2934712 RepID=UPI0020C119B5